MRVSVSASLVRSSVPSCVVMMLLSSNSFPSRLMIEHYKRFVVRDKQERERERELILNRC